MGQWTDDVNNMPAPQTEPGLSRMLTLEQVQEILNVKSSLVYALVRSGQLPAGQFGARGIWRVRESDLAAYIDGAFAKTAERSLLGRFPRSTSSKTIDHGTQNRRRPAPCKVPAFAALRPFPPLRLRLERPSRA